MPEWTGFNVQVSLRNLRSNEPRVIQKELRLLHLRWFLASEPKMRTLLQAAGVDEVRLSMIKLIVDTSFSSSIKREKWILCSSREPSVYMSLTEP